MRPLLVRLHRWLGLGLAAFLIITGLTGDVLPWQHELDAWLNPELFRADAAGPALPPARLIESIETRYPQVRVSYVPLVRHPGRAQEFGVEPRPGPETGERRFPGFDEVFIDPASAEILGTRHWGQAWPPTRENLLPVLYVLHYSLYLPGNWGLWLLGLAALGWTLDCFIALLLTLPPARRRQAQAAGESSPQKSWRERWAPAWKIRWRGGRTRLNFDLHRAGGLWLWPLLLIIAFTGFSLNLYSELFYPALEKLGNPTPSPYLTRSPGPQYLNREAAISFAGIIDRATEEGQRLGWQDGPGDVYYARPYGFYRLKFFSAGAPSGSHPLGPSLMFFDGADGSLLGLIESGSGSGSDLFSQAQFPLHSGNIGGLAGRIVVSALGLLVVMLTVTGVLIWLRKRAARSRPGRPATES